MARAENKEGRIPVSRPRRGTPSYILVFPFSFSVTACVFVIRRYHIDDA
jgi:hypothetical protein